jgi:uncharacterized protein YdcH (DUF465 family)
MNIPDRIEHLREHHRLLDRQIDEMAKHTVPCDLEIENLKKYRLQMRDELAILEQQHKDYK